MDIPEIRSIPYTRSDGIERVAKIIPVKLDLSHLSDNELQVIGNLAEAVNPIASIAAKQHHKKSKPLLRAAQNAERHARGKDKQRVDDYATLVDAKGGPFDMYGYGHVLDVPFYLKRSFDGLEPLIGVGARAPPVKGYYPEDITEEEFASLEHGKEIENSTVIRDYRANAFVVLNELRFRRECASILHALERAHSRAQEPSLNNYILAKIDEIKSGAKELRVASDIAWIANASKIDFVLGTGIETYDDEFKSIRGVAQGAVYVENIEYASVVRKLRDMLPDWHNEVPWDKSKDGESRIPVLKFVDVVNWAGGYDMFPVVVSAECLPNDDEIVAKYGAVNVIFVNTQDARTQDGVFDFTLQEFFTRDAAKYRDAMLSIDYTMTAAHELGHSQTPIVPINDSKRLFGTDTHVLEEARAECYSLWALPRMVRAGMISEKEEIGGYYEMIRTCVETLQKPPKDHSGSRNMMFHYYFADGAVKEVEEDGRTKYAIDVARMRESNTTFLGHLGTFKARLDADGFRVFKDRYVSTARQQEFKKRMEAMPMGTSLLFPVMEKINGRFTGNLSYPASFREQPRSLSRFL